MTWLDSKPADVVGDAIHALSKDPAAADALDYAGGDDRFALWLHLVDKRCRTVFGIGIFDLEDWTWRDAFDDGSSPKEALADFDDHFGLTEQLDE
jgi:hypothetical protein